MGVSHDEPEELTAHVMPVVDTIFLLTDARDANEELEGEHARGKIVLQTGAGET